MNQKARLRLTTSLAATLFALPSCSSDETTLVVPETNTQASVQPEILTEADPTIFQDSDGTYYLYGTGKQSDKGFFVYRSNDLTSWEGPIGSDGGFCLTSSMSFGTTGFWAPQVLAHNGEYYIIYTANEQIAIAKSYSPKGPFTQTEQQPIHIPGKAIDPFVLIDNDGKTYLYHVRLNDGNRIYVSEMTNDLMDIKEETTVECIHATEAWENTENASWPVTEGPTVLHIGDTYYLFYSANDYRNIDYAVGLATATSPFGPWTKSAQPIISRSNTGYYGTGHGDMLRDKDGNWWYVLHTHNSFTEVQLRKTAIVGMTFGEGGFAITDGSFRYLYKQ